MAVHDDFTAAFTGAVAAFEAGDFTLARRSVIKARMFYAQMPNVSANGVSENWRDALNSLEDSITRESGLTSRSATEQSSFEH